MRRPKDLPQAANARTQPSLSSPPGGGSLKCASKIIANRLREAAVTRHGSCVIVSASPPQADTLEGLLRRPDKSWGGNRGAPTCQPRIIRVGLGYSASDRDFADQIWWSTTGHYAPDHYTTELMWRLACDELCARQINCVIFEQFELALVDQSAMSRRHLFSRLAQLIKTFPIVFVLTGEPDLTRHLRSEVELLARVTIVPVGGRRNNLRRNLYGRRI
jgi:hypothetical protein